MKHIIPILVILLLLSSGFVGVSNTGEEQRVDIETLERDEFLDNLAFNYYDGYDSSKSEYYKEYFQRDSPEIADLEEITTPVESPQTSVSLGPMDSPWSKKCHDNNNTGRSPYSTSYVTGLEKWRFRASEGVDGSPIIGDDGTIYFGDKEGHVYAVHPNGTLKWKYHTGYNFITSAPALAEEGTLYVCSWDKYLYAFNSSNGEMKWRLFTDKILDLSSPAIAEDGTIYFGGHHQIFAVNPNGTEKWRYPTGSNVHSSPAIAEDGTIYIGSWDTYLYAMNSNGTEKWRFKTGDIIKGSASIADDGTVYFGSFDGYLYAIYPDNGTIKWKCKVGYGTESNPSIAHDGTIYVGSYQKFYAVYPNGTIRWSFDIGSTTEISWSCPAISADGTIYIGTQIGSTAGGDIIAINPDGTEKWRKRICDEWIRSSPCIAEDGTVYIGSQDNGGYLHAFGPVESNSPPDAPTISGTINGKVGVGYWYKFIAIDPDNNPISFYIEWGDETHTGWTSERASGENCYYGHTWSEQGDYTIRAKAKDVLGEESDWAILEVTMPMNQQTQNWWFLQFLQNHPRMFPILRQLLGL